MLAERRKVSLKTYYGPNLALTVSLVDAVFRDRDGRPVTMEFHPYCGPAFFDADGENFIPEEGDPIWDQFEGWHRAKRPKVPRGGLKDSTVMYTNLEPLGVTED